MEALVKITMQDLKDYLNNDLPVVLLLYSATALGMLAIYRLTWAPR